MPSALDQLQRFVDDYLRSRPTVRLLEAGCGSMSKIRLSGNVFVVGIDVSAKQLERNQGLHERILGDIQTFPLAEQSFDLIICWDVLEHLDDPVKALRNFFRAVRPGGLIILAFPNLYSVKGLITKLTPYPVHLWYYTHLLHVQNAGANDTPPFVTPFRLAVTYPAIRRLTKAHQGEVAFFAPRESPDMLYVRKKFWFMNLIMMTASLVSIALTFGRIDVAHSDCIMILRARADLNTGNRDIAAQAEQAHAPMAQ